MILSRVISRLGLSRYGWSGNYPTWEAAMRSSSGYDESSIVEKVRDAAVAVKNGKAAFERDSVLFYEPEYSWALLSGLMMVAAHNKGNLALMDFGGSLGSTYFQHQLFFSQLNGVRWNIVEQAAFCEAGRKHLEDDKLKFYPDIKSCMDAGPVQAVLLGCVLPYVEQPYQLLQTIMDHRFPFLLIDRMPFIDADEDRLTVQRVPPEIYSASYPAWFFSYKKFMRVVSQQYTVIAEYNCSDRANIKSTYKGHILKLRG